MFVYCHNGFTVIGEAAIMSRKTKSLPEASLVTFTVRLSPMLIKRAKVAATLLELSVQTVVSLALNEWLRAHEEKDQGPLLHRYARKAAAMRERGN